MALDNQQPTDQGRRLTDQRKVAQAGREDGFRRQDQLDQSYKPPRIIHSHKSRNTEPFSEGQQIDEPSKVVLVIVALTMIFIAVISYFIRQMPKQ